MMKNPRNLLIFAVLGGIVGVGLGFFVGSFTSVQSANFDRKTSHVSIVTVLNRQVDAWNSGDIESYMQEYLKSEELRFASGGTITKGWQTTLERYQARYPDRATMGQLKTENFEIKVIDADDALVFGSWELERAGDNPSGLYTLHLRKIDGDWVVVSDHTSSTE